MPGTRFILILVVLFAFAWRVHELAGQSLWRDEVDAVYFCLRRDFWPSIRINCGMDKKGRCIH